MTGFSPWLAANERTLILWFAVMCTFGLYSILYRENQIYRFFEHLFLGLATGFLVGNIWTDTLIPKWWKPMWDQGQWWYIFAVLAGVYYYFIYSKKHNWIARLIIGLYLGIASGQAFQAFANDTWPQIPGSFKPIIPHAAVAATAQHPAIKALSVWGALNNIIFMLIVILVMSYFFFSFEQRAPVLRNSAQIGRWLMMLTFGAIFGATMMARLALVIDRMDFVVNQFGPTLGGNSGRYIVFLVILVLLAVMVTLAARSNADAQSGEETNG